MNKNILLIIILAAGMAFGCATENRTQKGTLIGAALGTAVGAGVGYAVGGSKGAAIGAGSGMIAGGLTGASVGHYMDKQERELRQALASVEAAQIQRDLDVLSVSFREDVLFDVDSAILKSGALADIDRVATVLNKYPQTRIRIEGHTDSTGTERYNQDLSERRAEAVKRSLTAKGVDAARIETLGMGESRPVAGNQTREGRQMNRRVTIVIIPETASSAAYGTPGV